MIRRRQFLRVISAAAVIPAAPRLAFAQAYPSRPIKLVVPLLAGGAVDVAARIFAQALSERLGQPVIVENKPGGGTNIAVASVVNAPPDGYTLLLTLATSTINPALYKSLPFDFARDIVPVSGLADLPLVIDANKDLPVANLAEFIAYAKAHPGEVRFGSFGARTIGHLTVELIKHATGIDVIYVPYAGSAQLLTDTIAGHIHAGVDGLSALIPQIRSGTIRGVAVMSPQRVAVLPDVPAANETIKGLQVSGWTGIGAPKGTPAEIVERLNKDINAVLDSAAVRARYADIAALPLLMSPAQAKELVANDLTKWAKVVEQAGLKKE